MGRRNYFKSQYNRPNRNWECGRSRQGTPCPKGPTTHGKCAGAYECAPAFVENRWKCTRPEHYGGPCDSPTLGEQRKSGPIAKRDGTVQCCCPAGCSPRRSLRSKRRVATQATVSLGIAVLLIGMSFGPIRDRFLSPGPLTRHHQGASFGQDAVQQQNENSNTCKACHWSMSNDKEVYPLGWLSAAFDSNQSLSQNQKCLVCHQENWVSSPNSPHGLTPSILETLTQNARSRSLLTDPLMKVASTLGAPTSPNEELACATCHHEHQGRQHDLKVISDRQCQVCHTDRFNTFNTGHSAFATLETDGHTYPYDRRTRLIFDHDRKEHRESGSCITCHASDTNGRFMGLLPFEETCATAACHNTEFTNSQPIHFFGYPALTSDASEFLLDFDIDLQEWPETSPIQPYENLSPFMLSLLGTSASEYSGGQDQFEADVDELLDPANAGGSVSTLIEIYWEEEKEELPALERLAAALQFLKVRFNDQEADAQYGFLGKLVRSTGATPAIAEAMLGEFDSSKDLSAILSTIQSSPSVGWAVREEGNQLDAKSWTALLESIPEFVAAEAAASGGDAPPEARNFLNWFKDVSAFRKWFDGRIRVDGRDWKSRTSGLPVNKKDWEKFLTQSSQAEGLKALNELAKTNEQAKSFADWFTDPTKVKKWIGANIRLSVTGWYHADSARAVYYTPSKHADPFLRAWLNYAASNYTNSPGMRPLFDDLIGKSTGGTTSAGNCTKCHSIDIFADNPIAPAVRLNWNSKRNVREFTTFDHAPHQKLRDCTYCHEYVSGQGDFSYLGSFRTKNEIHGDFTTFRSNFVGLEKSLCSQCHTAQSAGSNCTICHNYHVERTPPPLGASSLDALFSSREAPEESNEESNEEAGTEAEEAD